ncbi:NADH:ubiquinone reductase (Na(+)-transporting) subunit C [Reichenbachiella carrageenanivorans]|uniref:Na(+)-translocating NADH-quinone reductase subunit C n=1 Tax=Reichenbachiella carrageenanivorans TaxID=2979869 RepID=A0ABY6D4H0_9BACT|nr:NADH:ubiquinone reductase (Na(+)-transporting) subunit C [Reichenbachiella carrageenanivorans]UXX80520.1 NADH:ubiquinone reductase (Na(+)-transporting) subunit C [Reichenbachiella carrageenanivorans]
MSGTSVVLKPLQDKQIELDTKKKILGAVDPSSVEGKTSDEILAYYKERVTSTVVDINGNPMETDAKGNKLVAEKIDFQKNHNKFKKDVEARPYPVFMYMKADGSGVEAYIFPMFGAGLWDWISGFVAVDSDLNTLKGVAFDHKSETPGLGARITEEAVKSRYIGKKIFGDNGDLLSVNMVKGEKGEPLDDHHIDGMSGATLTGKGVNAMLKDYFGYYSTYIEKTKASNQPVAEVVEPTEEMAEETVE